MKTSKRKRSAKTVPIVEAAGVDVAAAETPASVEPLMDSSTEASPAVVEALLSEPAAAEPSAEAAAEPMVEAAAESVAAAEETIVAEAAAEPAPIAEVVQAEPAQAEPAQAEPMQAAPVVVLNSNCSVKDAAALKTHLLSFAKHSDAVTVDVSAVERVDTATMQVLCTFVRDRSGRNQSVTWRGQSQALNDAVRLLGVSALLGLDSKGVAA